MNLAAIDSWQPPADWLRIRVIDAHTGGEPLRIFLDGFPPPQGETVLARRSDCLARLDRYRTATMWEPRGHADMYGCLIVPPEREDSDFGVIFTHNEGYSDMCGHGIVAVCTVLLETGAVPAVDGEVAFRIDSPAGLIRAWAEVDAGEVRSVRFYNVPSFVQCLDASVSVPEIGEVPFDLAFGGAWYAFVDAAAIGLSTDPENTTQMIDWGRRIKAAVSDSVPPQHPFDAELSTLYGVIFTDQPRHAGSDTRNVCIFADGEVDRSPTGTGVSARVAIAAARGEMSQGQVRVYESVIGSQFEGSVAEVAEFGGHAAVVPQVRGRASICGRSEFLLDPRDPLVDGFLLR